MFSAPTCWTKLAWRSTRAGWSCAPHSNRCRPDCTSRSASDSRAYSPVASMAVMFRSRTITTGLQLREVPCGQRELVGGPEQEGAVDAEDAHVGRHVLQLQAVHLPFLDVLGRDEGDRAGLRDAVDIEQGSQHHADLHGDGEVCKHRQAQCHEPHRAVRLPEPDHAGYLEPLAHVPRHHEQDGGQRRHRDVAGERCRHEHDRQQRPSVDEA